MGGFNDYAGRFRSLRRASTWIRAINRYRIEEAMKRLVDQNSTGSLLDIVYHAGFNSKSSFYNAFKKYTGMTPTQFKKSNTVSVH